MLTKGRVESDNNQNYDNRAHHDPELDSDILF